MLAQTYEDFELIIVDDGSTDDTREIVNNIPDQRIKYLWQENQKQSKARNYGIAEASGEYVAFLDSDDLWFPKKLELQMRALDEHPSSGAVYGYAQRLGPNLEPLQTQELLLCKGGVCCSNIRDALIVSNFIPTSSLVVKRELFDYVGGFDATFTYAEDWDLWIRLAGAVEFCRVNQMVSAYRVHPGSITGNHENELKCELDIIARYAQYGPTQTKQRAEMLVFANHAARAVEEELSNSRYWVGSAFALVHNREDSMILRSIFANAATSSVRSRSGFVKNMQSMAAAFDLIDGLGGYFTRNEWLSGYWKAVIQATWGIGDCFTALWAFAKLIACCGFKAIDRAALAVSVKATLQALRLSHTGKVQLQELNMNLEQFRKVQQEAQETVGNI